MRCLALLRVVKALVNLQIQTLLQLGFLQEICHKITLDYYNTIAPYLSIQKMRFVNHLTEQKIQHIAERLDVIWLFMAEDFGCSA